MNTLDTRAVNTPNTRVQSTHSVLVGHHQRCLCSKFSLFGDASVVNFHYFSYSYADVLRISASARGRCGRMLANSERAGERGLLKSSSSEVFRATHSQVFVFFSVTPY